MDFYKEFHKTLTVKKLEEQIEFVDWTLVPRRLFTAKFKKKFGSIPKIKVSIWIKELLKSFEIKENIKRYPGQIFFFYQGNCYIEYNIESKTMWCSSEKLWSKIERELSLSQEETQTYLRKMIENNLKFKPFNPVEDNVGFTDIENYFNSLKITTQERKNILIEAFEIARKNHKNFDFMLKEECGSLLSTYIEKACISQRVILEDFYACSLKDLTKLLDEVC